MKNSSENKKPEFKIKDAISVFSLFTFICFAVIFAFMIFDALTIKNLLSHDKPIESIIISVVSSVALLVFGVILAFTIPSNYIDNTNKTHQDNSLTDIIIFMFIAAMFE
ncbi:hypothetical protein [Sporosarcina sp. P20a]|uniref:hypothetical protein n=1 Tax=Sporosarcina sp. P20a TaxID=2048256 RepID=UPI001E5C9C25|nr:hypothetical protein [Sporosarcina sp. P20a]